MAGRILNRREMRKQTDQAEQQAEVAPDAVAVAETPPKKKARAKAAAVPKVRKPRAKKAPPRMRARWGVFDGGMKQVAVFDYNQRTAAEEKVADLASRNKGTHFLQIVKDEMPAAPPPVEQAV